MVDTANVEMNFSKDTQIIPNLKSLALPSLNFSKIERNQYVSHSMPNTKTTAERLASKDMQVETLASLSLAKEQPDSFCLVKDRFVALQFKHRKSVHIYELDSGETTAYW